MAGASGSLGSLWVEIGAKIDNFKKGMDDAKKALDEALKGMADAGKGTEPFKDLPAKSKPPIDAVADAFRQLGITSTAELQKTADASKAAFEVVSKSGKSSAGDIEAAFNKMQADELAAIKSTTVAVSTQFEKFNADVSKAIKDAETKFEGLSQIGSKMTGFGVGLSAAVTVPIVGIGAAALKASGDFDTAMKLVSARGDITGQDLKRLQGQAEELGAKTQFSSRQAAEGMAELAGAGFNTQQIYTAMPGIMNLAAAATTDVGTASKVTKDIMGQFGLQAKDTGTIVDLVTKASNMSSGSLIEMANSLKYVGPPATAAGFSLEDTAAALVALDKAGIRSEQAGTALRSMFQSLSGPTDKAREAMRNLGIGLQDTNGNLLPIPRILDELSKGMEGMTGKADRAALMTTIFGENASTAAQALLKDGGPALIAIQKELHDFGSEAERTAGVMQSGMGGALERMRGSIETAAQKLGDVFAPAIKDIAGWIESAANKLAALAGWFADIPGPVQEVTLAILGFAAALGPLLIIAGQFAGSIGSITAALNLVGPLLGGSAALSAEMGAAMATAGGIASSLLGPAIIAVAAALVLMEIPNTISQLQELEEVFALTQRTTVTSESTFKELASAFDLGGTAAQGFGGSLATIQDPLQNCIDRTNETNEAWTRLQEKWARTSWTDMINPLHAITETIRELKDEIKFLTGVYPEMKKAGEDASKSLMTHNLATMKVMGDNAVAAQKLADAHAKAAAGVKKFGASLGETKKAHEDAAKAADKHALAVQKAFGDMETRYKKQAEDFAKQIKDRVALEEKIAALDIKLGQEALDREVMYGKAHEQVYKEGRKQVEITVDLQKRLPPEIYAAIVALNKLEAGYKDLGVSSPKALQMQVDAARIAYDTILTDTTAGTQKINEAWVKYEKLRQANAIAHNEVITKEEKAELKRVEDLVTGHHSKEVDKWKDFNKQVSTIITDAGKNIVERFQKVFAGNDKLDEDAAKLKESLKSREEDYAEFAAKTAASLSEARAGYAEALAKEEEQLQESLDKRGEDYEEFADSVADKLGELRDKHAKEAEKERKDLEDQLDDRNQDYDDYVEDIGKNVDEIRNDNKKSIAKETKDLQASLADKTKDYNRYVEDVNAKLVKIREKNKGQQSEEEQDLLKSLARRTEDFEDYKKENAEKLQEFTDEHNAQAQKQEQDQLDSLARKTRDHEQYKLDIQEKLEAVTTKHQEQLGKEEQDLADSLAKKKQEYEDYKIEVAGKLEDFRTEALAKLTKQESDLQSSLDTQKGKWETYKEDINAKLQEIQDKHIGIFGAVGSVAEGIFTDMGTALGRFVSEQLVGSLFKEFGRLVSVILPGVDSALGGIFTKMGGKVAEKVGETAVDTTADVATKTAGGGISDVIGGAIGSSLTGIVTAVASVATAISSIVGNFQMAAMNKSLDLIENYTRYLKIGLVEQGDSLLNDSHIIRNMATNADHNYWGTTAPFFQDVMTKLEKLGGVDFKLGEIDDKMRFAQLRLDAIGTDTSSMRAIAERDTFTQMLDQLKLIAQKDLVVNVNVGTPQASTTTNVKLNGIPTV